MIRERYKDNCLMKRVEEGEWVIRRAKENGFIYEYSDKELALYVEETNRPNQTANAILTQAHGAFLAQCGDWEVVIRQGSCPDDVFLKAAGAKVRRRLSPEAREKAAARLRKLHTSKKLPYDRGH